MMEQTPGLYLTLMDDGAIRKHLITATGAVIEEESTIMNELILYSEIDYTPYADLMEHLDSWNFHLQINGEEIFEDVNMFEFHRFATLADETLALLEESRPLSGTLMRLQLDQHVPCDDGSAMYPFLAHEQAMLCLKEPMLFQFTIKSVLSDLEEKLPIDTENKYDYLRKSQFTQITILDGTLSSQYYFSSEEEYCRFLLLHFINRNPNVALCRCCGRFFIPKTRKKTLYCDRIVHEGKTCKEVAPRLKHKVNSQNEIIIEEFDRAKRRMYKRYERTLDEKKPSGKDLEYTQYYAWLKKAADARDKCLAGKMPEEEALKVINVP